MTRRAYQVSGLDSENRIRKDYSLLNVQIDRIRIHTTPCFQEVNKRKERERQELRQEGEEAKRAKLTDTL
jgi:hypothetical protein